MRRVDFLGASGVGKSTTYALALANRERDTWLTRDEAAALMSPPQDRRSRDWEQYLFDCAVVAFDPPAWIEPRHAVTLLDLARDAAAMESSFLPGVVVFDESVTLRTMGFAFRRADPLRSARRYATRLPRPAAIVYWHADPQTITDRLAARTGKPRMPPMRGLEGRALLDAVTRLVKVAALGADVLEERGVPVLRLDAYRPAHALAVELRKFLDEVR